MNSFDKPPKPADISNFNSCKVLQISSLKIGTLVMSPIKVAIYCLTESEIERCLAFEGLSL